MFCNGCSQREPVVRVEFLSFEPFKLFGVNADLCAVCLEGVFRFPYRIVKRYG